MKSDIILAGVGGQGILSIATVISVAALRKNLYLKQSELHGMSQRGGAVESHLRLSDQPISSDVIPQGKADIILAVEPMEALRYIPFLCKEGWVVTNSVPFINIAHYPETENVFSALNNLPHVVMLDADKMAVEAGTIKASNMVMLGATLPFLPFSVEDIKNAISDIFLSKGEKIVETNINAMLAGYKHSTLTK